MFILPSYPRPPTALCHLQIECSSTKLRSMTETAIQQYSGTRWDTLGHVLNSRSFSCARNTCNTGVVYAFVGQPGSAYANVSMQRHERQQLSSRRSVVVPATRVADFIHTGQLCSAHSPNRLSEHFARTQARPAHSEQVKSASERLWSSQGTQPPGHRDISDIITASSAPSTLQIGQSAGSRTPRGEHPEHASKVGHT